MGKVGVSVIIRTFRVGMDERDASTVCVFKPYCITVSASSPNPRLPQHWSSGGISQVR